MLVNSVVTFILLISPVWTFQRQIILHFCGFRGDNVLTGGTVTCKFPSMLLRRVTTSNLGHYATPAFQSSLHTHHVNVQVMYKCALSPLACERRRISGCRDSLRGENLDSRKYVCVRRLLALKQGMVYCFLSFLLN